MNPFNNVLAHICLQNGNSGGPVIDLANGLVVGINVKAHKHIGTAVRSEDISDFLEKVWHSQTSQGKL